MNNKQYTDLDILRVLRSVPRYKMGEKDKTLIIGAIEEMKSRVSRQYECDGNCGQCKRKKCKPKV